jgi:hypothetical protein
MQCDHYCHKIYPARRDPSTVMTIDAHEKAARRQRRIEILKHRRSCKKLSSVSGGAVPTAMTVKASKAEARRQKNRLSAEVSRLRRQQEVDDCRARIMNLEDENAALRNRVHFLEGGAFTSKASSNKSKPHSQLQAYTVPYHDEYILSRFTGFEPAAF